ILQLKELQDAPIEDYPADVQHEHRVFMEFIDSYPGLLACLMDGKEEDIIHVGELAGKEASGAQGDDIKTPKFAILEWLMPRGQPLILPLSWNIKLDCGFNHDITSRLLFPVGLDQSDIETKQSLKSSEIAVSGDQWPMFSYAGHKYDPDNPWKNLLRSGILIFVSFKHVFMSPSLVDKEKKATWAHNAYLHDMKSITKDSLAYIATQIQFALSSSSYHSILYLLEEPNEIKEVTDLMMW
ncbi:hypothetical protein BDR06DRAFT_900155, partial [Suillus hirtellus]